MRIQEDSEAKALYDKEAENGDTKAMFILGMKYSDENNFEKAKKMFDMILQKDPKYTDALIEIGMLYKNQKNYKEAEKYYKKAISIKKTARYLTNLGVVYTLQLEENKAEKLYKEAIQMGGDGSEAAIYNLGILYYSNKRYKEAKKLLEEAANKGNLKAKEFLKEMEKTNEQQKYEYNKFSDSTKNTSVQSNGDIKITSDRVLVLNDKANVLVNK